MPASSGLPAEHSALWRSRPFLAAVSMILSPSPVWLCWNSEIACQLKMINLASCRAGMNDQPRPTIQRSKGSSIEIILKNSCSKSSGMISIEGKSGGVRCGTPGALKSHWPLERWGYIFPWSFPSLLFVGVANYHGITLAIVHRGVEKQNQTQDRYLSFALIFKDTSSKVTFIYPLFILHSASGMLIKSVVLNNCFLSTNSQKAPCCIWYPEGIWKMCVLCGNYFLCHCSCFPHGYVKTTTIHHHAMMVGQMRGDTDGGRKPKLPSPTFNFFKDKYSDFI